MSIRSFGFLGSTFQIELLKVIIEDKTFAATIIEYVESSYFDNTYFKYIMQIVKEYYEDHQKIPTYETIRLTMKSEHEGKDVPKIYIDTLDEIRDREEIVDEEYIKITATNFCKQQVLVKEIKKIQKIIDNGRFEDYDKIEEIIRTAIQVGATTDDVEDVFHDILNALETELREPIPTGIDGIDSVLLGGLSKGELGVIIAPTGVGKTTILTKFANSAYNIGKNVLHIFFEDNKINIKQKHFTIWSGISPYKQLENKEEVKTKVDEAQARSDGRLYLMKLPSDSVTIGKIKSKLRKLKIEGFEPDLIIIDYVDCIVSERSSETGEEWKGEGVIMRHLETMCTEFNTAMWVATQGSRASIGADVVTTDQMAGSIKKAFVGHIVISIAKSLIQKENKLANIAILKSRIGPDGNVFEDCTFDNELLRIDTDQVTTFLGFKEEKEQQKQSRASDVYKGKTEAQ